MRDFKELKVWAKAHQIALSIYKATVTFPKEEMYGLTSQMRRASVSIAANIAEGCGRKSKADFAHFLQMALGSASELEYLLILANELKLLMSKQADLLINDVIEIKRMLTVFIQKLNADN